MNYLVAILPDRIQAESAYTQLEKAGLPQDQIAIVGRGFLSAEEVGLANPTVTARKRAVRMAVWLVPFGFVGGFLFNIQTGYYLLPSAGDVVNHLLGGLLGAVGGAMGSTFIGGGLILSPDGDGPTNLPYQEALKDGKFLVVFKGTSAGWKQQAEKVLQGLKPENLASYSLSQF